MPGAFGERVDAHGDERVVGSLKLLARVDAPTRTTQPLAEEQPAARELGTEPGAPQAIDRLAVQALGRLTLAQQRARPRVEAQRPVGVARTRVLAQSLQTTRRELGVLRPAGGLDQLAERPHRDEQLRCVVARLDGRRERLVVVAEPVHDDRIGPMRVLDRGPLATRGCVLDGGANQLGGLGLVSTERREHQRAVRADAGTGGLPDRIRLGDQQRRRNEVAAQGDRLTEHVDAHGEDLERP